MTSAWPCQVAVASEKTVSPSPIVCDGDTARDSPSSAISATRLTSAFVRRAFVATIASVVLLARPGGAAERQRRPEQDASIGEALAVVGADAGDDHAGRRVDDVADRVDGGDRADDESVRKRDRRRAESRLHRPFAAAEELADRRACSGADVAFSDSGRRSQPSPHDSRTRRSA